MAFKDLSQGNKNLLSTTAQGELLIESPSSISLYPDVDNTTGDREVWLRDGTRLVFDGTTAGGTKMSLQATTLSANRTLTLPDKTGTLTIQADLDAAVTALTNTINALTTDDIAEGANLYFTIQRARDSVDVSSTTRGATYNPATGEFNIQAGVTSVNGFTGDVILNTTMVAETAPTTNTLSGDALDEGDMWYNSTTGTLHIFYDNFWVDVAPTPGGQSDLQLNSLGIGTPSNGIDGDLVVNHDLTVYNDATVSGNTTISGTTTLNGDVLWDSVGNSFTISSDTTQRGTFRWTTDGTVIWNLLHKADESLNFDRVNGTGWIQIEGSNIVTEATIASVIPTLTNVNATTLDGIDSTNFLRSDQSDTMNGSLTVTGSTTSASFSTTGSTSTGSLTVTGSTSVSSVTATGAITSASFSTTGNITSSSLSVLGNITATGDVTAYFSDERLKDFKGKIENAVDKVKQINGYYYTPNDKAAELGYDKSKVEVGVSAQEVNNILPEVVAQAPVDSEYLTVKYERLAPLLIEAIKEQQAVIEELTARLNKLEGNK